jgi:hypothetical protein
MAFESVDGVVATLNSAVKRIRDAISEARTLTEQRANTAMYNISELLELIASMLSRAKCIVAAKGGSPPVAQLCSTWRLIEVEDTPLLIRTKPATAIAVRGGAIVFQRDHVYMELRGGKVKLCKWKYCKEVDPASRSQVTEILPQLNYLLREVSWHVVKSYEALTLCAKREEPSCLR